MDSESDKDVKDEPKDNIDLITPDTTHTRPEDIVCKIEGDFNEEGNEFIEDDTDEDSDEDNDDNDDSYQKEQRYYANTSKINQLFRTLSNFPKYIVYIFLSNLELFPYCCNRKGVFLNT